MDKREINLFKKVSPLGLIYCSKWSSVQQYLIQISLLYYLSILVNIFLFEDDSEDIIEIFIT